MGQDNITIDRTYFKLPGDNSSDDLKNFKMFYGPMYPTVGKQLKEYLDMMSIVEEYQKSEQQEQSSPVEDEELDEDLEDNVQNGDEPSGEGSWQSGNNSLKNVPSERFSISKKLRNFFN